MGDISVSEKYTAYTFQVEVSQGGKGAGYLGEMKGNESGSAGVGGNR
jgi:hypothetical protein